MELMKMTMREVKEYLEKYDTVIIPIGAVEEHSDALPLGTDIFTAEALSIELGKRKNRVVGPSISLGNSNSITMDFAGTVSLSPKTLILVIEDYLKSLYKHGFRKFLFVNGHGGNIAPIRCAIDELVDSFKETRFAVGSWWLFKELSDIYDNSGHAGRGEVSMMLFLNENIVHKEWFSKEERSIPPYFVSSDLVKEEITRTGVINDSQNGTKELGKELFQRAIEVYENLLDKLES